MHAYTVGDRVRIDVPDVEDPDHLEFHGQVGEIVEVYHDDLGSVTGDPRDAVAYRVRLDDSGDEFDFRWRDVRPWV